MSIISIKVDNSVLEARLRKQQQALSKLPKDSLAQFKSLTPVRSGNARSKTVLSGNNSKIIGNYNYATRLDQGASRQAPKGMVGPFTEWFKKELKKITGR